jgi:hypothetical protein
MSAEEAQAPMVFFYGVILTPAHYRLGFER